MRFSHGVASFRFSQTRFTYQVTAILDFRQPAFTVISAVAGFAINRRGVVGWRR